MNKVDVAILELNLLKEIEFTSSLYSDHSHTTMLYRHILELIRLREEKILALSESQSVSDNETKKKLCEYYPDKCDYDKDFDCPYMDNEDILCYEQ